MMRRLVPWLVAFASCVSQTTDGAPYRPADDSEVLERLPSASGAERKALRDLRVRIMENPNDRELALGLARRYLDLARADSDPRYNGYAEAVLAPWLQSANPPSEALVLRANLRQNRHEFDAALDDLSMALARHPRLAAGWLTRAAIFEVKGNYADAYASCVPLTRIASPLVVAVCLNSALSLSGEAEPSYRRIIAAIARHPSDNPALLWALSVAGELAERLALHADAEALYRRALDLGLRNAYLLTAFADFLLDRNRPGEVASLLDGETRADSLLLRLTLAEQRLGRPEESGHRAALAARFEASRLRGDATHQADEARYLLHLKGDPAKALQLAQANWQVQREPRDARILLESAIAAGRPDAAEPVRRHIEQNRLEDRRLAALITKLPTVPR